MFAKEDWFSFIVDDVFVEKIEELGHVTSIEFVEDAEGVDGVYVPEPRVFYS